MTGLNKFVELEGQVDGFVGYFEVNDVYWDSNGRRQDDVRLPSFP